MLQSVDVGERSLDSYDGVASAELLAELRAVGARLRGLRILHLNATPYGGGVAELLRSSIPLLNDLGLIAEWQTISGDQSFFEVTKAIHNGLQGSDRTLDPGEKAAYRAASEANAAQLHGLYDVTIVHDPQPAALPSLADKGDGRWVWRCHIDTSGPNGDTWSFIRPYLAVYDAAVFTLERFIPPDLRLPCVEVIPPAIDPLSPKNCELDQAMAAGILDWLGVELDRPLITQISRFDPWKDPIGVIEAYRLVRDAAPGLQLVLAGSMALDDPEGWRIYREISAATRNDPSIHLFTNLTGVGNVEVNALQRISDVVVQKSIREGFGLVVSEAMWKGTPVVAGRAGGIPLQMADGAGGILVDSTADCAQAIAELLRDSEQAERLAAKGRTRVREHFLLPRLLLDELLLIEQLMTGAEPIIGRAPGGGRYDPVCGMSLDPSAAQAVERYRGEDYSFCSEACLTRFRHRPGHYVPDLASKGPDGITGAMTSSVQPRG